MNEFIEFTDKKEESVFRIPNRWEYLSPDQFEYVISLVNEYASGKISLVELRTLYVCKTMGWKLQKIHGEDSWANLYFLADKVTFLFEIKYDDAVLQPLTAKERSLVKSVVPQRLPIHLRRYLEKHEYRFVLKDSFCAQLIPSIKLDGKIYHGYSASSDFNMLTCSLTAIQYIEASEIISRGKESELLPLIAAILYYPGKYDSEGAKKLAFKFINLPAGQLWAILFNFKCLINFIFNQTEFNLLTKSTLKSSSTIVTGALESMYELCADGIGKAADVESINIITYLTLIRKKLIQSIKTMHSYQMKMNEIEEESGLPINIIEEILK